MLSDNNFYKPLTKDPTNKFQLANNKLINLLKTSNQIDETTKKELIINNSVAPRLYALPKTHKNPLKFRPIVSCIDSPTYKLAKYINKILTNINDTLTYNIKNSFELINLINNLTIPDNHILISIDVTDLFTNIPKKLVVKAINNKWNLISFFTNIQLNDFIELVEFCFNSSYFLFDGLFLPTNFRLRDGEPSLSNFRESCYE